MRFVAIESLGRLKDPAAIKALQELVEGEDKEMANSAKKAIKKIQDAQKVK